LITSFAAAAIELDQMARVANHLEAAADALLRASLMLRDHVMGEVMFA
jgi:hypothetical protein